MGDDRRTRGLGRGLSALMADVATSGSAEQPRSERLVPIEEIVPNPEQPRRHFDEEALDELAQSIREKGLLQPLIVRPRADGTARFEIVAGERRWRAAQRAQVHEVPVIVRDLDDREVLEVAIVENVQRADLNPVDEARGYRQLIDAFGHTQDRLATVLGKSRSHIANSLRLLTLPEGVLDLITQGALTAGHARALVPLDDPLAAAREIVAKKLSVREAERLVKRLQGAPGRRPPGGTGPGPGSSDADTQVLSQDLAAALDLPVEIAYDATSGGGTVTLRYRDLDELDRLCALLSSTPPDESR